MKRKGFKNNSKIVCVTVFITLLVFAGLSRAQTATGPLIVHPDNPRYFTDGSGKAIYLTGSHTWANLVIQWTSYPGSNHDYFDFTDYLDNMDDWNHNFIRLWAVDHIRYSYSRFAYPFMYPRTGSGTAIDSGQKFNLDSFNQAYFDRLLARVVAAEARDIYVSIMLFDGYTHNSGVSYNHEGHLFHGGNNEDVSADIDDFYEQTSGTVWNYQMKYVEKVIDTVQHMDNVLYEICNECGGSTHTWQKAIIDHIKAYEIAQGYDKHPVGLTYAIGSSENYMLWNSNADWVSPGDETQYGCSDCADYMKNPPKWEDSVGSTDKVVIVDTDHVCVGDRSDSCPATLGESGWRDLVWKNFMRGNNIIYMDAYHDQSGNPFDNDYYYYQTARDNMGYTLTYAEKMNLANMFPSDSTFYCSTRYCLVNPGVEYLVYQPGSGSFTANLMAGEYGYEWFNPDTGSVQGTGTITASGGSRSFSPPFSGDAVLYIFTDSESCSDLGGVDCCILPQTCQGSSIAGSSCSGTCCDQECYTPPTEELIIDNGDSGTSQIGTWGASSGANPYGGGSLSSMAVGETYHWEGTVSGTNEVYLWWTYWASRCTSIPVQIYDGSTLLDTVTVNHQQNAGQWNLLGTYTFTGTGRVKLPTTSSSCSTCADAVRFLPVVQVCTDVDGDGYGSPASPLCTHPELDCDDNNPDVNPGVTEICDNSLDDDCDGQADSQDSDCSGLPKLQVSTNNRFLMTESGTPFFYMADTGWTINKLDQSELETYFIDRESKGFNVVQGPNIMMMNWGQEDTYGNYAILNNNLNQPNEAFFSHLDYIVDIAEDYGIYMAMVPIWYPNFASYTNTEIYDFGFYLGNRYRNKNNVIWLTGGEAAENIPDDQVRAMATGLEAGHQGNHLITVHAKYFSSSSSSFHNDNWLDFNMWQTVSHTDNANYNMITSDYNLVPVKPVVDGESWYEDIANGEGPRGTAFDVRKLSYWAVFAGALGHTYGANGVWQSHMPDAPYTSWNPRDYWYDAIDYEASFDMEHLRDMIESRPFFSRIPDQSIILSAQGTLNTRVQATRDSDAGSRGSYSFIYITDGHTINVDMSKITGTDVTAYWFNPRTGEATLIGEYPASGSRQFTPPSSGTNNDWVLVLDDKSKNYPAPGSVIIPTCTNLGYHCCDSCIPGTAQPAYDTDCPGSQLCCDECENPLVDCTGLVMLLHMDNDPNYGETPTHVYDFSGQGNSGSCTDCPSWTSSGMPGFGGAFDFDGSNDYIGISDDSSLDMTDTITVSAWIYGHDWTNTETNFIVAKRDYSGGEIENYQFDVTTNGHLQFKFYNGGYISFEDDAVLSTNRWYHVAATYDRSNIILYIDGSVAGTSGSITAAMLPNANTLSVGICYRDTPPSDFGEWNGLIDDVAIWNRALSADEIHDLYHMDMPIFCGPFHRADISPRNGCIDDNELIPFIDLWMRDSTINPMWEVMEAVTMYYSPEAWC